MPSRFSPQRTDGSFGSWVLGSPGNSTGSRASSLKPKPVNPEATMTPDPTATSEEVYTIPRLAERLGVSDQSVRNWIRSGQIEPPQEIPATGERVYPAEAAARIERDYMIRAASGGTRGPGASERRQRAQAWLEENDVEPDENGQEPVVAQEGPRVDRDVESAPDIPHDCPAARVYRAVRRWLVLDDHLLPIMPLVVGVANWLTGPPVWLMIVAPPSSGKSEVIRGLNGVKGVRHISSITASTFASGMMASAGSARAPSLLERMEKRGQWLLTLKDFGTIQSVQQETRNEIFGQLREIYDGQFDATYGTGVEINWKGKIGMLVGATPAVDRQYKWSAELGERFVQFRPTAPDPKAVSMMAVGAADQEDQKNDEIQDAYRTAFEELGDQLSGDGDTPGLSEDQRSIVAALARFTANARRPVRHQRGGGYQVLPPEGPARLAKVFVQLYEAALICLGEDDQLARRVVGRVTVDSIPGRRGKLLRALAEDPEGVSARSMSQWLGCDKETARKELEELEAIKLVDSIQPATTEVYKASDDLYAAAQGVYPDAKSGQEALRKLYDRRINPSPERERKTNGEREEG